MKKSDIGLIGLAVMGENLAMNIANKGFTVSVYNRTTEKVKMFIKGRAKGKNILGAYSLKELVDHLAKPRKIMIMIKAGKPVDSTIKQLVPLLEKGDIIIDGGNSNFEDTEVRTRYIEERGLFYLGAGISGGEEGALKGPSIMPGGSPDAWPHVKQIFQSISAKVEDGTSCCQWVGKGGAGHFVKMIHNGIEYGDMQLISEIYHIMRDYLEMTNDEMHDVFAEWNEKELESYLIEITRDILAFRDENGNAVVDQILDTAGQKGTGKWTAIAALNEGVTLTLIAEAVFSRYLSTIKEERIAASKILKGPAQLFAGNRQKMLHDLKQALYAAKIVSYAQGYSLMRVAADTYGWDLKYGDIALMWRGGCIIRSAFLGEIKTAFDKNPNLTNLLLDDFFCDAINNAQDSWRRVVVEATLNGIPIPAIASALSYYDGYRCEQLPANLIQAQRDYFGTHTYEKKGVPRGEFFHTNWTGEGGNTAASMYKA